MIKYLYGLTFRNRYVIESWVLGRVVAVNQKTKRDMHFYPASKSKQIKFYSVRRLVEGGRGNKVPQCNSAKAQK